MGGLIATMLEHAAVGLGVDLVVLGAAGIYVLSDTRTPDFNRLSTAPAGEMIVVMGRVPALA